MRSKRKIRLRRNSKRRVNYYCRTNSQTTIDTRYGIRYIKGSFGMQQYLQPHNRNKCISGLTSFCIAVLNYYYEFVARHLKRNSSEYASTTPQVFSQRKYKQFTPKKSLNFHPKSGLLSLRIWNYKFLQMKKTSKTT